MLWKNKWKLLIICFLSSFTFAYGLFVGKYEIFPYKIIASLREELQGVLETFDTLSTDSENEVIVTQLLNLSKKESNSFNSEILYGLGGALTVLEDRIVGVDKNSEFFLFNTDDSIERLNIGLDTNLDSLMLFIKDDAERDHVTEIFRVTDLLHYKEGGKSYLVASYQYWNDKEQCKTMRVARLNDVSIESLQTQAYSSDSWQTILETNPCLPYGANSTSPMISNRNGGRLAILEPGKLLLSTGDNQYDGVDNVELYPQRDDIPYGKLLLIDLNSFDVTIFSKGHRNPQGLLVDSKQRVWVTEHGPRGGDELNYVIEGGNYGWPFVTLGTNYGSYSWPLNPEQGRHIGFRAPVYSWLPSVGISNLVEVQGFHEAWDGDFLIGSLYGTTLYRARIDSTNSLMFAEPIRLGERIRDIVLIDGTIVIWTDSSKLIRLRLHESEEFIVNSIALTTEELENGIDKVLIKCSQCHSLDENTSDNDQRLSLWNVYNREIGGTAYGSYSAALRNTEGIWDASNLASYIRNPNAFIQGTSMPSPQVNDSLKVALLIEYLMRLQN